MNKKKLLLIAVTVLAAAAVCIGVLLLSAQESPIPKMYFEGDISEMHEKSDVRNITVTYRDGEKSFEAYAEIKIQGTSSLGYAKKNYTVKFYADEEHEKKKSVDVGWGEQSKYCLKANWIDKTHARNVVTAKLVSQMQAKYGLLEQAPANGAIDGFPIEIYSNGKFLGIYTFNIPKDDWMFAMDGDDPDHIVVCGEGWEPANLFRGMPTFSDWAVEVGEENEQTQAKLERLFDFVMNSTDEEFRAHFEEYMDLDAALNYYVMLDFAYLPDNLGKNMLLATYDGEVWYPSLYDLDTSWGAHWSGSKLYEYKEKFAQDTNDNKLFLRMEKCFAQELSDRYFELREQILTKENVMGEFEAFESAIPESSFRKEAERWGESIPGFDISQIETYLDEMIPMLDEKYAAMGGA